MKKKNLIFSLFGILILGITVLLFIEKENKKPTRLLPFFGPKGQSSGEREHHQIPPYSFFDQNGNSVTEKFTEDKIYVADFFFTTCQSICPVMSNQMQRLTVAFQQDTDVVFLSHTVNPEFDSIPVLSNYAQQHKADSKQWKFLTGSKQEIYHIARKGYLMTAEEGDGGADDFIHTQNFALIDWNRKIRGFYDGTDSVDINRLIIDIKLLEDEKRWRNANR